MDIRPVGLGPADAGVSRAQGQIAPLKSSAAAEILLRSQLPLPDIAAVELAGLSEPDLARLGAIIERPLPESVIARVEELSNSASQSATSGDVARAISLVGEFVKLDPRRADTVASEPAFQPMRADLERLLVQLREVAKIDAEAHVDRAAQLLKETGITRIAEWDAPAETVLGVASHLIEYGTYFNCTSGTELARVVAENCNAPRTASRSGIGLSYRFVEHTRKLWKHAPLLVLLLGWLALGLVVGGTAALTRSSLPRLTELWASGFLALILFGLYMRIRNLRL